MRRALRPFRHMPARQLRFVDRARVHLLLNPKLGLRRARASLTVSPRGAAIPHWLISAYRTGVPLERT